jgi:hypothetical protein
VGVQPAGVDHVDLPIELVDQVFGRQGLAAVSDQAEAGLARPGRVDDQAQHH